MTQRLNVGSIIYILYNIIYYTLDQRHRQSSTIKNRYVCLVKMHNAVDDNFIVTIFLSTVSCQYISKLF